MIAKLVIIFFVCHYCKTAIERDKMQTRCVLNGLKIVDLPSELAKLDCLSRQFIQRAKAYQIVFRLGTYRNNVPTYNMLKACKGDMFFLPLPMHKTIATLEKVDESNIALATTDLYIIFNGKPNKRQHNVTAWSKLTILRKL